MIKFVHDWMIGAAKAKLHSVLLCLHDDFTDEELTTLIKAYEVLESKK